MGTDCYASNNDSAVTIDQFAVEKMATELINRIWQMRDSLVTGDYSHNNSLLTFVLTHR